MSELTTILGKLSNLRHLWASIARDMVLMTLPQPSRTTAVSPEDIRATYGLSSAELVQLMNIPGFKDIFQKEVQLAEDLGLRAAHAFRTAEMAAGAAEALYIRLQDPTTKVDDLVKGYVALARSAGLDSLPDKREKAAVGSASVAVQINVPQLSNPKVSHVRVYESAEGVA